MVRKIAWVTMTVLAVLIGVYGGLTILTPAVRPPPLQNLFDTVPIAVITHLAGGLIAIIVGAFQVNSRLRARFLPAHWWLGRLYVGAVVVSATAGFTLALGSHGGLSWRISDLARWRSADRGVVHTDAEGADGADRIDYAAARFESTGNNQDGSPVTEEAFE